MILLQQCVHWLIETLDCRLRKCSFIRIFASPFRCYRGKPHYHNVEKCLSFLLSKHVGLKFLILYSNCDDLESSSLTLTQRELFFWFDLWAIRWPPVHKNSDSLESIYGQKGLWVGNPCQWASGIKYQSCYLWGEPSAAVETPWCQRHAGYSFTSQIGLDTLRIWWWGGGQRWWKVMSTHVLEQQHQAPSTPTHPAGCGLAPK